MKSALSVRKMAMIAVLCAMEVVLSRIAAINVGAYLKISFGFIPVAVCGILFGPAWAAMMAAVADVIGATLFPTAMFFPGFTLVAVVGGLIYGLFLYRKEPGLVRCLLCTAAVALVCNIVMNTMFLSMTGAIVPPDNEAFWPTVGTRALKNAIQFPVNGLILFAVWKGVRRLPAAAREG